MCIRDRSYTGNSSENIDFILARTAFNNRLEASLNGPEFDVSFASFSPDGEWLVTNDSNDGDIRVWSLDENGQWQSQVLRSNEDYIHQVSFSPDGKWLTAEGSVGTTSTVYIWELDENKQWQSQVLQDQGGWRITGVSFSHDGEHLVTVKGTVDTDTVYVWALNALRQWQYQALSRHQGSINNARISPDGQRLVTASDDKTAQVWLLAETGRWQFEQVLEGHQGSVNDASFSPDGQRLVTASNEARIWELDKNKQ